MYVSIYVFGCKTRIWSIYDVIYMIEIAMNIILNCLYFKQQLINNGFGDSTVSNTPIVIYNLKQFDYIYIYTF